MFLICHPLADALDVSFRVQHGTCSSRHHVSIPRWKKEDMEEEDGEEKTECQLSLLPFKELSWKPHQGLVTSRWPGLYDVATLNCKEDQKTC